MYYFLSSYTGGNYAKKVEGFTVTLMGSGTNTPGIVLISSCKQIEVAEGV
jgi:hypothetical protein